MEIWGETHVAKRARGAIGVVKIFFSFGPKNH